MILLLLCTCCTHCYTGITHIRKSYHRDRTKQNEYSHVEIGSVDHPDCRVELVPSSINRPVRFVKSFFTILFHAFQRAPKNVTFFECETFFFVIQFCFNGKTSFFFFEFSEYMSACIFLVIFRFFHHLLLFFFFLAFFFRRTLTTT